MRVGVQGSQTVGWAKSSNVQTSGAPEAGQTSPAAAASAPGGSKRKLEEAQVNVTAGRLASRSWQAPPAPSVTAQRWGVAMQAEGHSDVALRGTQWGHIVAWVPNGTRLVILFEEG